jgi:four helix bundle protein
VREREGERARLSLFQRSPLAIGKCMPTIRSYRELRVYQGAFECAMIIFNLTKNFPQEERFSLVDQMRRSSRSVCANIAEAWRKRKYEAHFTSKLSDSSAEADETRVWLELSLSCGYMDQAAFNDLDERYDAVIGQLVKMMSEPKNWTIK